MTTTAAPPRTGERRKGLAVASLVLGLIGLLTLGALSLPAIVGIVFGLIALNKARRNPAKYDGRGLAIGGIVAGAVAIVLGITCALMLAFLIRPVRIEGSAMSPTLNNGDRAFIWLRVEEVKRGDIVTLWYPDDPSKSFIKRVIGLPGETVTIDKSGVVYINGGALDEPYLSHDRNRVPRAIPETMVKSHYYFVMGDNRDASNDSRSWGLVPEKYIYGELISTY
jgi:signal peptidase I